MQLATPRLIHQLRQWCYPPEFRIEPPVWSPKLLAEFERLVALDKPQAQKPAQTNLARTLAEVGTGVWRLRQKMLQPGTSQPSEEMRRTFRHVEAMWDALKRAKVEIIDHTNTPYDPGLSISVLAFQPQPGLTREMVVETIKPTIYFDQERIQMGEVLIGTPTIIVDAAQDGVASSSASPETAVQPKSSVLAVEPEQFKLAEQLTNREMSANPEQETTYATRND